MTGLEMVTNPFNPDRVVSDGRNNADARQQALQPKFARTPVEPKKRDYFKAYSGNTRGFKDFSIFGVF